MSVPGIINDGNFTVAMQNGAGSWSFPFWDKGDNKTFIYRRPMRIDQRFFTPPTASTQRNFPGLGTGYLVDIDPPTVVFGTNLIDYNEVYASKPITRTEYGTSVFNVQIPINGTQRYVGAFIDLFPARYVYEYSVGTPLPILYRPQLIKVDYAQGAGAQIVQVGLWQDYSNGLNILTDNSISKIWMGQIYERLSIYVDLPTLSIPPALNT